MVNKYIKNAQHHYSISEISINITMKYFYIHCRMAENKRPNYIKSWQKYETNIIADGNVK